MLGVSQFQTPLPIPKWTEESRMCTFLICGELPDGIETQSSDWFLGNQIFS